MANTFNNLTNGLAQLKNYYEGPIVSQFNDDMPFYRAIEKDKKSWSGLQVVRPLKVNRNQGIGATSDGGALPAIGIQGTVQAIIAAKYNYLRFGITGPMIKASASDIGSFVRSASYNLEQGYVDLKNDCNRQFLWNGNGTLATMAAAAVASTSLSIAGRESTEAALKFLDVGTVIDIVTSGGTIEASAVTITAITGGPNDLTATLTVNTAVTVSSASLIIRSGSLNNEIQGVLYAEDGATSTIYNVNRSTYPSFQGNLISNSNGTLTLDALEQTHDAGQRRGGGEYGAIFCDFASRRMYNKLLVADKRFVNTTTQGDGGFAKKGKQYLTYNEIPVIADKDCPTRFIFVNGSAFTNYVLAEMEFAKGNVGELKSIKIGEGCDANTEQTREEISLAA